MGGVEGGEIIRSVFGATWRGLSLGRDKNRDSTSGQKPQNKVGRERFPPLARRRGGMVMT